jgi:hypothetical protein
MAAAVTVLVGTTGLIIGWFISGYQKITENSQRNVVVHT